MSNDEPGSCLFASDACAPAEQPRKMARKRRAPVANGLYSRIVSCSLGPRGGISLSLEGGIDAWWFLPSYRQPEK